MTAVAGGHAPVNGIAGAVLGLHQSRQLRRHAAAAEGRLPARHAGSGALRTMHDKDLARMHAFPDVPDEAVRAVRAKTLIVCGDRDTVLPEHAVELTRLIPDARLLILPGGHGDYLSDVVMTGRATRYPELVAGLIEEFLSEETP